MKKLKIFLLLSILLGLGFTLSSEVHAQGNGPKVFEVGDVLPATTQLRISWTESISNLASSNPDYGFYSQIFMESSLSGSNSSLIICEGEKNDDEPPLIEYMFQFYNGSTFVNIINWRSDSISFNSPYTDFGGNHDYCIVDTSNLSTSQRTVKLVSVSDSGLTGLFVWEDLNAPSGYTITFNSNGGTTIPDIENVTELPLYLPIPTKENHTFLGWYYNSAFTQIANAGDIIESNVTLYAKWELNAYKAFEVGDELPAGNIKISWDLTGYDVGETGDDWMILSDGVPLDLTIDITEYVWENTFITMDIIFGGSDPNTGFYESFYLDTPGYTIITLTNPCTITSHDGSADYHEHIGGFIFWEVVSPDYLGGYDNVYDGEQLEIEEGTILPEAKIGINLLYNNTGGPKSGTVTFTFSDTEYEYGQIIFTAQEDNLGTKVTSAEITVQTNPSPRGWDIYTIDDSLAIQTFGSTRGILFASILLDFRWLPTEARTITDITVEGDLELDIIFTRILTEVEIAYQEGYSNGYTTAREIFGWKYGDDWYNGIDAWNLGEKYVRELYGWYDSSTDEWLTVDEYVARYGTDKPGQSDFYNNFDKYFIPAMIIVFGGAIVLTILKVFKGRE